EAAGDQLAPLRVQRIVGADHPRVGGHVRPVTALLLVGADEDLLGLLDLEDVVVARDPPELVDGVPVDRRVVAHPRVRRVGVGHVEGAAEEVDVHVFGAARASMTSRPSAGSMNDVKSGPRRRWWPPSTSMISPVIQRESSPTRNRASAATSSGSPTPSARL